MGGRNVWVNWGRNQRCEPAAVEWPESTLEVAEAIGRARRAGQTVKAVGSGHSFTDVACTGGRMVRLDALDRVLAVDRDASTVTVEAGIPLWKLNQALAERGLALANLGDIDRQTVSGALATGTHGTGAGFPGLAGLVRGLELVTAEGDVLRCSPDEEPDVYSCARVSLGALGIVTAVTLAVVPAFRLHLVERPRRLDDVLADLDETVAAHDHFEIEHWFPHTDVCLVKELDRTDEPLRTRPPLVEWRDDILLGNHGFGLLARLGRRAPETVPALARFVSSQLRTVDVVDRSDRAFCSPRLVRFVEMEYAVPAERAVEALRGVRRVIEERDLRISIPVEVRWAAADDVPLSTAYGRRSAYVAVHVFEGSPHEEYFAGVEELMQGLEGRPHWGKLHHRDASSLAPLYAEWDRFLDVRDRLDPHGRFRNAYLDRVLGAPGGASRWAPPRSSDEAGRSS